MPITKMGEVMLIMLYLVKNSGINPDHLFNFPSSLNHIAHGGIFWLARESTLLNS